MADINNPADLIAAGIPVKKMTKDGLVTLENIGALPAKNHNNPPSDVEWLGENLTLRNVHIIRAAEEHAELAKNIPDHFEQENEAEFTSDFIARMQNCQKELERRRKEEKEPFLRQGQYVDSFFGDLHTTLDAAINKAFRPLNDWWKRKADAERAERERDAAMLREQQEIALRNASAAAPENKSEAVQIAVEAVQQVRTAETLAAAPITSMAKSVGTVSKGALVSKWVGVITDVDQLDLNKLRPYISGTELQRALDRYVKQGGRVCDGTEIKEEISGKVNNAKKQ